MILLLYARVRLVVGVDERGVHDLLHACCLCRVNSVAVRSLTLGSDKRHGDERQPFCALKCFRQAVGVVEICDSRFNAHVGVLFQRFGVIAAEDKIVLIL